LKALREALVEIGDQDIYTDSWEYRGRVNAMGSLIGILRRSNHGQRVTEKQVTEALKVAELDRRVGREY
jgi:hypothetical protein